TLSGHDREKACRDRARSATPLAARGLVDHPPLWPARTGRPHRARRHRLAAPRGGARRLPFPDRLAENRAPVLEKRRDGRRSALGRGACRGRCRQGPLVERRRTPTRSLTLAASPIKGGATISANISVTVPAARPCAGLPGTRQEFP